MSDRIDKVTKAIREKIGARHQGLPKGGWDGLMRLAAIAAIEAMSEPGYCTCGQHCTNQCDECRALTLSSPDRTTNTEQERQ